MVVPADSDGNAWKKWMQNALRFVMKKRSFCSLINNFWSLFQSYLSKRKNFYFSSQIWGCFAFTFCIYLHQNLQVLPSKSVAGNTLRFRWKKQYIFQTKFFSLEFEGISYNSVVLCRLVVKMNSFVRFLEEFTAWQLAFEINWPLDLKVKYHKLKYWPWCLVQFSRPRN